MRRTFIQRIVAIVMLLFMLSAAITPLAMAVGTSAVSDQVAKPWVGTNVPWAGNWGAYNTNQSELTGGNCLLSPAAVNDLRNLLPALEKDWQHVQGMNSLSQKAKIALYKKVLVARIATGSSGKLLQDSAGTVRKGQSWNLIPFKRSLPDPTKLGTQATYTGFIHALSVDTKVSACPIVDKSLSGMAEDFIPNPIDLFSQPAGFITRLILFNPMIISYATYELIGESALQSTFLTPHSERGDTLYNTLKAQAIVAHGVNCRGTQCSQQNGDRLVTCKKGPNGNKNASQLGFSCSSALTAGENGGFWITITKVFRTMLSAVYGLIVIAVALIYLFRRNAGAAYDVKVVLPKVLGAVLISAAAPFFIGFLITTSNFMVRGLFTGIASGSIYNEVTGSILDLKHAASSVGDKSAIGGLPAQILGSLLPILLLCLTAFIMVILALGAIIKQLGLIALIVATPFAALSFIVPKWNGLFGMWCRGLLAITVIPIVQALIMRTGIELAGAFDNVGVGTGGVMDATMAFMRAMILAVTLIAVAMVFFKALTYITGLNKHPILKNAAGLAVAGGVGLATGGTSLAVQGAAAAARGMAKGAAKTTGKHGRGLDEDGNARADRNWAQKKIDNAATRQNFRQLKEGAGDTVKGKAQRDSKGNVLSRESSRWKLFAGAAMMRSRGMFERGEYRQKYIRDIPGKNPFAAPSTFRNRDQRKGGDDPLSLALMGKTTGGKAGRLAKILQETPAAAPRASTVDARGATIETDTVEVNAKHSRGHGSENRNRSPLSGTDLGRVRDGRGAHKLASDHKPAARAAARAATPATPTTTKPPVTSGGGGPAPAPSGGRQRSPQAPDSPRPAKSTGESGARPAESSGEGAKERPPGARTINRTRRPRNSG